MTDNFSLGDKKIDTKITESVGKSPLEQSAGNPDNQKEVGQNTDQTPPSVNSAFNEPKVNPEPPTPPQSLEPQDKPTQTSPGLDLPSGVISVPTSGATASQTTPSTPSLPDQPAPVPPVLQEKPQDAGESEGQPLAQTQDPAILDALKQEPKATPPLETNAPEPKPDLPPVEQPKPEQDFGEPSKAPDTDEFLKSILDDKTGMPGGSTPPLEEELSPNTPPAQTGQTPISSPETQSSNTDLSNELNTVEHRETPPSVNAPEATSLNEKSPIDGQSMNTNQNGNKPTGGVGIDSISSNEPPTAQGDDMLSANRPKPKSSPIKIILAIFLAVAVVAVGYYVYTILFSAQDATTQTGTDTGEIDYAAGLETESYATDDEQRKADLGKIKEALLNYYAGQGQFPIAQSLTLLTTGNILETELVPTHLSALPADPSTAKSYGYKSDGTTFTLTAILDDSSDTEAVVEGNQAVYSIVYDPAKASASVSATSTPKNSSSASPEVMPTGEDELSGGTY